MAVVALYFGIRIPACRTPAGMWIDGEGVPSWAVQEPFCWVASYG